MAAKQFHLYDLHCHTPFSDAQRDLDTIITGLIDIGIEVVGFADHINPVSLFRQPKRFGDERRLVYNHSYKQLVYRKKFFRILDKKYKKIRILNGGEIDIYPHGGLALPRKITPDFFDYLLLVKHHTLPKPLTTIPFKKHPRTEEWLWHNDPALRLNEHLWFKGLQAAFSRWKPDVFGHVQEGLPKHMGERKLKQIVLLAKQHGVALELNHFPEKELKPMLEYGHEVGAVFSLGSDFHGFQEDVAGQLRHSREMAELAEKYDLQLLDPRKFVSKIDAAP